MDAKKRNAIPRATKRTSGPRRKAPRFLPSQFISADGIIQTQEETDFMMAMDRYKTSNRRPFPTWRETLAVMKSLGYRKVAEATPLPTLAPKPLIVQREKP